MQVLRTFAASDASSSFSSVVHESIAVAVDVDAKLMFAETKLLSFKKMFRSAASSMFCYVQLRACRTNGEKLIYHTTSKSI